MVIKILPSNPDYPYYEQLWQLYSMAKNPTMWMSGDDLITWSNQDASDIADLAEILETLENYMQDLLDGLPIEFLKGMIKIGIGAHVVE